ncbi:MAG: hypothetical protein AAGH65_05915 [Pseudomonadota bacterium]
MRFHPHLKPIGKQLDRIGIDTIGIREFDEGLVIDRVLQAVVPVNSQFCEALDRQSARLRNRYVVQ